MIDLTTSPQYDAISRVLLVVSEEAEYRAGDETGRTMEVQCPWGTQQMANDILAKVRGYRYQPFSAVTAFEADPLWELGDAVSVNGLTSMLAAHTVQFGTAYTEDIEAPNGEELEHEYPYTSGTQQEIKRIVARTTSSLRVEVDNITAQVTEEAGAWQPDTEYFPGVIVIHGGTKYVCTEQHTSGDTFDAQYWEETDKDRYYAFLKLKSDGLHIGNDEGETYINGASIKAGTIKTSQIVVDGSISFTGGLNEALEESKNPDYIKATYIDHTKIVAPNVVGGEMFATGQGDSAGTNPAFYVCDGTTGTGGALTPNAPKGWLCYDKNGVEPDEAKNRVFLHSEPDVALKIEAGGNMSIEAAGSVYLESGLVLKEGVNYGTQLPDPTNIPEGTLFFIMR